MVSRAPASAATRSRQGGRARKWLLRLAVLGLFLGLAGAAAFLWFMQDQGIAPRVLGPYLQVRATGHNPTIEAIGRGLHGALYALDRGGAADAGPVLVPPLSLGFQASAAATGTGGRDILVDSPEQLRAAVKAAVPGDVITLMPGLYTIRGNVKVDGAGGTEGAPIVVRARQAGQVQLELNAQEGFIVSRPWWRFENLEIKGVCAEHQYCEHAFHVVGKAAHFAAVNNRIVDFNAHFKINGDEGAFPDAGLIESNTLTNTEVRRTKNPVTPIDLVAASDWVARRNIISDFIKKEGNRVSYGGFFKGGGMRNQFDQNLVICEQRLRGLPGQRVGLSLGGGGTGQPYCRDGKCITEQEESVLSNNLVLSCSDDGFYINSAARSKVLHNTLVDTGGISVRFSSSSADVQGNLVDGAVRSRDGGVLRVDDSADTATAWLYAGRHPLRSLFRDSQAFDFGWRGDAPRRRQGSSVPARDLCGAARPASARYGAFEDFSACLAP